MAEDLTVPFLLRSCLFPSAVKLHSLRVPTPLLDLLVDSFIHARHFTHLTSSFLPPGYFSPVFSTNVELTIDRMIRLLLYINHESAGNISVTIVALSLVINKLN